MTPSDQEGRLEPGAFWRSHQYVMGGQFRDGKAYPSECLGVLRVEDDVAGRPLAVRCDGCGELLGVFRGDGPSASDASPPDRDRFDDGQPWRRKGRKKAAAATPADHSDDPFLGAT